MNSICRNSKVYPVLRCIVPDDKLSWSIPWPTYSPGYFTAPHLKNCSWADPEISEWKRSSDKSKIIKTLTDQPILQFLAIKRKDCGKWAIPGGFLNTNEDSSTAVLRELFEEAVNPDKFSDNNKAKIEKFFSTGKEVYKGYVDDPRNTDNAWIETTACNFHDESGEETNNLVLEARDDAADVKWVDIIEDMEIYETHCDIINTVNEIHCKSAKTKDN